MKTKILVLFSSLFLVACGGGNKSAPPIFSAASAAVSTAENTLVTSYQANATGQSAITYSISGGADMAAFTLSSDGALSFDVPPDFEAPTDANGDNNYELTVQARNTAGQTATQAVTVTVTNIPFAISNLQVAPGADPRSAEFSWDVVEQTADFSEFVLLSNLDGQSVLTDHLAGITASSAAAEISLLQTDFVNAEFQVEARDANGAALAQSGVLQLDNQLSTEELIGYFKSSNTDANDQFGWSVAISGLGTTVAVGAYLESTATQADPSDNSAPQSGAVYVFARDGLVWTQQAFIKAPVIGPYDKFGAFVELDGDGDTLLVSATNETSSATGVNGNMADNSVNSSGAAYVFARSGTTWSFEAYLKSAVSLANQNFGESLAISADGDKVAIGAPGQALTAPGAVYLFSRTSGTWSYDRSILAASTEPDDLFGKSVAMDDFGLVLAVGAIREDSADRGINGNSADNTSPDSGAVYVFAYDSLNDIWIEDAYIKAPNSDRTDSFGHSIALSSDGNVLVSGAPREQSVAGNPADNSISSAGAAYVYSNSGSWQFDAILKSQYNIAGNRWGEKVDISGNGMTIAVAGVGESSSGVGVQSSGADSNTNNAGAVAMHQLVGGTWMFDRLLKSSNTESGDLLAWSVALSDAGDVLVSGAPREDGDAVGINGTDNNNVQDAGAAYIY